MMMTWDNKSTDGKRKYAAQEKYDAANTRTFTLKLNRKTDADIIEYLETAGNKQGAVKAALRAIMKAGT